MKKDKDCGCGNKSKKKPKNTVSKEGIIVTIIKPIFKRK